MTYEEGIELLRIKLLNEQNKIARDIQLQRENNSVWVAKLQTLSHVIELIDAVVNRARL